MNAIASHRFPWTEADEAYLARRKREGARHKSIARELHRTPRAVDQQVARMKELGLLKMHRNEELELLRSVEREAASPEMYRNEVL